MREHLHREGQGLPHVVRLRGSALLAVALAFVPNNPAAFWYAAPEEACDLLTADQDQWRCDEEPVTWSRHVVGRFRQPLGAAGQR